MLDNTRRGVVSVEKNFVSNSLYFEKGEAAVLLKCHPAQAAYQQSRE
jgi:hypothetical protein